MELGDEPADSLLPLGGVELRLEGDRLGERLVDGEEGREEVVLRVPRERRILVGRDLGLGLARVRVRVRVKVG